MKKVLMICQNYYPEIGSAANRMKNIHVRLKERGYDVTVLTSEPSYPNRNLYKNKEFWNEEISEEDVIRVQTKTRKYTRNMLNRLLLYLEVTFKFILAILKMNKEYDVVFVSSPPIFSGIAGIIAKKKLEAKLILDIRDLWPESLLGVGVFTNKYIIRVASWLERYLYRKADKIIINSEYFGAHITSNGVSKEKISFMPNSLTQEEIAYSTEGKDSRNEKISIVYTGNIGLAQDVLKLIAVAEKLKDRTNITFKIIGYGVHTKEVKRLIAEKRLINIELLSAKTRKETLKAVVSADIAYVSLVKKDVFEKVLPGKLIDYMGMKKPIIGDVSGYAAKVIKEANCGIIATENSIDEICDNILTLSENVQLRNEMGGNGYRYTLQRWIWKKNIDVLTDLMEEIDEEQSLHVCVEPLHK
ncbi:glycosyltransferase family 4 protein [Priestia taiwanensis]|uniref:Glycosyltransferase WbuB n=1 Tax=Priestia taiwanensis TaxID=1347902 RepID=A0A917AIE6_9BACI|nr:glycosyltransferase family 4 protein [Priestia taiwanensis]MBM7361607.1 glycosyltransferase involved in cell wall biosynthesis [Priestia taiwanensis]GGE55468.1 glycosyltransferase WbuB [Priestia taiwanensis]